MERVSDVVNVQQIRFKITCWNPQFTEPYKQRMPKDVHCDKDDIVEEGLIKWDSFKDTNSLPQMNF